jgi:O-antigen ligase
MKALYYIYIYIFLSVTLVLHPAAYRFHQTPKNFLLIISVAIVFVCYWIIRIVKSNKILNVTIIEVLLLIQLIWVVITNPSIVVHPSDLDFWILFSLVLLTFLIRQIAYNNIKSSDKNLPFTSFVNKKFITIFLRTLWITGLFQAIYGLYQWFRFREYISPVLKTPMTGTIGMANPYGLFLAVSIIALCIDIKNLQSFVRRILLSFCLIIMVGALLLNKSRGALLGLISSGIIVLIFIFINEKDIDTKKRAVARYLAYVSVKLKKIPRIILLCIIIFCFSGFGFFLYRINSESSSGRLMAWEVSTPMIADHPLLGVGYGRFDVEYLDYQARYFRNPDNMKIAYKAANLNQPHNQYLQAFCEGGIPGGLLFLSVWIIALWCVYQFLRKDGDNKTPFYGLGAVLLAILVHCLVDTPLNVLPISVVIYSVLGLVPVDSFSYRIELKSRIIQSGFLLLLFGYTCFTLVKAYRQYPGYIEWQKGNRYREKHKYELAVEHFKTALEKLPGKGELQFHLGASLGMLRDYDEGKKLLTESLKGHKDQNVYISLCIAHMRLKDYEKAEQYALTVHTMFPDHLAPHLLLGEIYYHQGDTLFSQASLNKCMNRKTRVQSPVVIQIARAARRKWDELYGSDKFDRGK